VIFPRLPKNVDVSKFTNDDIAILQRAVRWQRKKTIEWLLPNERASKCYRIRIKEDVSILYSSKLSRAHFGGLMVCGSIWICPVCAVKISERRRIELEGAKTEGLSMMMITVTLKHNATDKLKSLVDDLNEAWRFVTSGRGWQDIKMIYGIVASVTGREVTYSKVNGWHPHLHILYYSKKSVEVLDEIEIKKFVYDRFIVALNRKGRTASFEHGVDIKTGRNLSAQYIVKTGLGSWTLVSEVTKAHVKKARGEGHMSPLQMLDFYANGDKFFGIKFIEYAHAMKGKRQLVYSRNARQILGLEEVEKTDEELATEQEEDAILLARITSEGWKVVMKMEKRFTILEVASTGDIKYFETYCKALGIQII
jgi:hypothetical protein